MIVQPVSAVAARYSNARRSPARGAEDIFMLNSSLLFLISFAKHLSKAAAECTSGNAAAQKKNRTAARSVGFRSASPSKAKRLGQAAASGRPEGAVLVLSGDFSNHG